MKEKFETLDRKEKNIMKEKQRFEGEKNFKNIYIQLLKWKTHMDQTSDKEKIGDIGREATQNTKTKRWKSTRLRDIEDE